MVFIPSENVKSKSFNHYLNLTSLKIKSHSHNIIYIVYGNRAQ